MSLRTLEFLDVALWAAAGIVLGLLACYGRRVQRTGRNYFKVWLAYAIGLLLAFGVVMLIHDIEHRAGFRDIFGYGGVALMFVLMLAITFPLCRLKRRAGTGRADLDETSRN